MLQKHLGPKLLDVCMYTLRSYGVEMIKGKDLSFIKIRIGKLELLGSYVEENMLAVILG